MPARLPWPVHAAAVAGLALALWLAYGAASIGQDTVVILEWGRQIAAGDMPGYESPFAPTPHPLTAAVLALWSVLGRDGALVLTVATSYVSYAGLVWGIAMVGRQLSGWPGAAVAGVLGLVSSEFALRGLLVAQDIPAAALVLAALLVAMRRPDSGRGVLLLLLAAGLLRPEVWLLAAAYWLWRAKGAPRRVQLEEMVLAGAAPFLWLLSDFLVTGDPLHSGRVTHGGAEILNRARGLGAVPETMRNGLELNLGDVGVAVAAVGLAAALAVARARAAWPAAVLGLSLLGFVGLGAAEVSLLPRYLFVASALMCGFLAFALTGWIRERGRVRAAWALVAAALGAGFVAGDVPDQLDRIGDVRADARAQGRALLALRDLADDPRARAVLERCKPLVTPSAAAASAAGWALEIGQRGVTIPAFRPQPDVFLEASSADARYLSLSRFFSDPGVRYVAPPGLAAAARTRDWTLAASAACRS